MTHRSIGMLWSALLFVAILLAVTIMLSAAQLLAQTPPAAIAHDEDVARLAAVGVPWGTRSRS